MKKLSILLLFFLGIQWTAAAQSYQENYNYFINPLPVGIQLSGSFGELRNNHFHTGLDMKTCGDEGLPVSAAAEGYVSRIGVSAGGYGNVLYVTHPNGFTTVYGHLWRFATPIAKWVKSAQLNNQAFELDVNLDPGQFPVKKGELIAFSGNTGGSGGPHLHFEVRESQSQRPVNPMLFGLTVKDDIPPLIKGIKIYVLDSTGYVKVYFNGKRAPIRAGFQQNIKLNATKGAKSYVLSGVNRIEGFGRLGFAVETVDFANGNSNKLGVYSIQLCIDNQLRYQKEMSVLDFNLKRFINAHTDYAEHKKSGAWFEKSFIGASNSLPIYSTLVDNGVVMLSPGSTHHVAYYCVDFNANSSVLPFEISSPEVPEVMPPVPPAIFSYIVPYDKQFTIDSPEIKATFPAGTFYEDVYFTYSKEALKGKVYSNYHILDNPSIPVNDFFTIAIKPVDLPERLRSKVGIMSHTAGYVGGEWDKGFLTGKARSLGKYYIVADTTPPSVRPLNIRDGINLTGKGFITFKASDNLSGIAKYQAFIDDKYVVLQRDAKTATMWYEFDDQCGPGNHIFTIRVADARGNVTVQKYKFYRAR